MEDKLSRDKSCSGCDFYSSEGLKKLGIKTDNFDYVVALAGNPNTGKSTVFNTLTGLRQHTGNWPGKTVIRAEGAYSYDGKKYKVVDLPGTYSLLSTSTDEEIARNFILFGNPSVTVIVADASRLERNLNLILQTLEITNRAVLCLNLMDEAERNDIEINDRALARELGIPVVPTSARFGNGMPELLKTIHDMAEGKIICKPHRFKNVPEKISKAIEKLSDEIRTLYPNIPNYRWLALRLLEGDERIIEAFNSGELSSYGA